MAPRKKKLKGGGQFEILNKVLTFIVASEEMSSIDFYSGSKEKKLKGGVQFEILKKSGIDFYSGFRKTSQGGCNSNS